MTTKTDQVAHEIVQRIRTNDWSPGVRLPVAEVLMEEFGVSRGTVRSALDRVCGQGLIYKRGNGWYVERRELNS